MWLSVASVPVAPWHGALERALFHLGYIRLCGRRTWVYHPRVARLWVGRRGCDKTAKAVNHTHLASPVPWHPREETHGHGNLEFPGMPDTDGSDWVEVRGAWGSEGEDSCLGRGSPSRPPPDTSRPLSLPSHPHLDPIITLRGIHRNEDYHHVSTKFGG